jgi:predicted dehydrogenase
MKKYRGAILGCGQVSRHHLRGWEQIKDVEIVALYNRTYSRAVERAQEFDIPVEHVYDDYLDLLEKENLDFIDVASAPNAHKEQVIAAAKHGYHILCQKPLALTDQDILEMIAACKAANVLFSVNENWRWRTWYREIKELLERRVIGEPRYIRITKHSNITLSGEDGSPPSLTKKQPYTMDLDHLIIFEWGTHILDVLRFLFGEIISVYASMDKVSPYFKGEDRAALLMNVNGVTALFDASWASWNKPPEMLEQVVIEGDEGKIEILPEAGNVLRVTSRSETWERPAFQGEPEDAYQASYTTACRHFIDCLRTGEMPETVIEDNYKTVAATFAAYKSADKGQVVYL